MLFTVSPDDDAASWTERSPCSLGPYNPVLKHVNGMVLLSTVN